MWNNAKRSAPGMLIHALLSPLSKETVQQCALLCAHARRCVYTLGREKKGSTKYNPGLGKANTLIALSIIRFGLQ